MSRQGKAKGQCKEKQNGKARQGKRESITRQSKAKGQSKTRQKGKARKVKRAKHDKARQGKRV